MNQGRRLVALKVFPSKGREHVMTVSEPPQHLGSAAAQQVFGSSALRQRAIERRRRVIFVSW